MSIVFTGFDVFGVRNVVWNMRRADQDEVFATRQDEDAELICAELRLGLGNCAWFETVWSGGHAGDPVAIFAVHPLSPGVGSAMMLATDGLTMAGALAMIRRVRRVVIPALMDAGFHRVECASIEGHKASHGFLRLCGAKAEGRIEQLGRHRENFIRFRWLASDINPSGE